MRIILNVVYLSDGYIVFLKSCKEGRADIKLSTIRR